MTLLYFLFTITSDNQCFLNMLGIGEFHQGTNFSTASSLIRYAIAYLYSKIFFGYIEIDFNTFIIIIHLIAIFLIKMNGTKVFKQGCLRINQE